LATPWSTGQGTREFAATRANATRNVEEKIEREIVRGVGSMVVVWCAVVVVLVVVVLLVAVIWKEKPPHSYSYSYSLHRKKKKEERAGGERFFSLFRIFAFSLLFSEEHVFHRDKRDS
jgi:small-conductance mechanosensitive channel